MLDLTKKILKKLLKMYFLKKCQRITGKYDDNDSIIKDSQERNKTVKQKK